MSEDDHVEQLRQKYSFGYYGDAATPDNIVTGHHITPEDAIAFDHAARPHLDHARAEALRSRATLDTNSRISRIANIVRPNRTPRERRPQRRRTAATLHAARAPARPGDRPRLARLTDALLALLGVRR